MEVLGTVRRTASERLAEYGIKAFNGGRIRKKQKRLLVINKNQLLAEVLRSPIRRWDINGLYLKLASNVAALSLGKDLSCAQLYRQDARGARGKKLLLCLTKVGKSSKFLLTGKCL